MEAEKTEISAEEKAAHHGRVRFDAPACPQQITYPTDISLLSDAREKTEELIDWPTSIAPATKAAYLRQSGTKRVFKGCPKKEEVQGTDQERDRQAAAFPGNKILIYGSLAVQLLHD